MRTTTWLPIIPALLILVVVCAGCGGGGGGGTPVSTLGLDVTGPTLTGKTGQTLSVPVSVTGTDTVKTASFNLHFNSGVFEPAAGVTIGGSSVAIADTGSGVVARYKWIDSQTVKVLYASSAGAGTGSVIINIPLKVKAETTSALVVQNVSINK